MLTIIIKAILATVSMMIFIVYIFFNSIIGLLDLTPSVNASKAKSKVDNAKRKVLSAKKKLQKGIIKRASGRAASVFAQAAVPIPLVGAGVAATTVIAISADEYCETQNTLNNIFLILEDKKEKDINISECTELIYRDTIKASKNSGSDFKKWANSSYDESSQWLTEKYGDTSNWVSESYDDTSVWISDSYNKSGDWIDDKWNSTFSSDE
jgi:hypothetical protein